MKNDFYLDKSQFYPIRQEIIEVKQSGKGTFVLKYGKSTLLIRSRPNDMKRIELNIKT